MVTGPSYAPLLFVFDGDPATPRKKGTPTPTQFLAHVYCGQMAGWMKAPLGTEIDLGPGHTVLDLIPALHERGTAAPLFLAHVCCGHGRRSQLLLSSCCSSADEFLVMLIAEDICERWLGLCRYADVDIGLVTLVGMAVSVAHGLHIRADVPQYVYLYS